MKFIIERESILPVLQQLVSVIEKRQTMPILGNILIKAESDFLSFTGTDLEIQLLACVSAKISQPGSLTIPARKLLDLCRYLPPNCEITFEQYSDKVRILTKSGRFTFSSLPSESYPDFNESDLSKSFSLPAEVLCNALGKTLFCMANQDVRYYLNGLLLSVSTSTLKMVASDGHRLSIYETKFQIPSDVDDRLILPRKAALELYRLLSNVNGEITVYFSNGNIRIVLDHLTFSAKLVDAKYPDFSKVFQQDFLPSIKLPKLLIKESLTRVAVLANEKFKAITLDFSDNLLRITTHNPEHDEAEENIPVIYSEKPLTISFNSQYLQEAISYIEGDEVVFSISNNSSCCFIEESIPVNYKFIVMPMRL